MAWDLIPAFTKKSKVSKEIAIISDNVKQIQDDSRKMGTALTTLNNNVQLIDNTIENIKAADYGVVKNYINELDLDDEYKETLNQELENSRESALATLIPIKNASEKIRGNMAVSMVKYQNMTTSLQAQKNVIESGAIQVETIDKAIAQGAMNSDVITELVGRAEAINNVTEQAVLDYGKGAANLKNTLSAFGGNDGQSIDALFKSSPKKKPTVVEVTPDHV